VNALAGMDVFTAGELADVMDLDPELSALGKIPLNVRLEAGSVLNGLREHERRCRVCGCTDELGCAEGCEWVESDLCSQCDPATRVEDEPPPLAPAEKPYAYEVTIARFDGTTERRIYSARSEKEAVRKARLLSRCEMVENVEPMSEKVYRARCGDRKVNR
jgi:hypothetical protein